MQSSNLSKFNVPIRLKVKAIEATINRADNHPQRNKPWVGVSAEAKVLRSDFGLDRNVPRVGDEVSIYIEVELQKL